MYDLFIEVLKTFPFSSSELPVLVTLGSVVSLLSNLRRRYTRPHQEVFVR